MKHIDQPRGDRNEITTNDEPTVHIGREISAAPLTFAEAEQHNPYGLLTELHDHAVNVNLRVEHSQDPNHHLGELALSAAVVAWWSRWQPISMHRAFQAGASLTEVAAATGTSEADAFSRWSVWADAQSTLIIGGKPCVDPAEVAAINSRLGHSPTI